MPTLSWIGKKAVENHHRHVPFHLLKDMPELSIGDPGSGNLIVEGDNLIALKALLPYYAGQVKCIIIDPPYNSGEQTWTYNDHVSSPEIRDWLNRTVGREFDDLTRHDKWLCMMYPRMSLLCQFLRDDGILFVCLDDTELYRFRLMMEEVGLGISFVTTLVWKSRRNLDSRSKHNVSIDHEYVVVFKKPNARFRGATKDFSKYSNPDNDPRGPWMSDNLVGLATKDRRPNLHYTLLDPSTGRKYACPAKGWRYSQETMARKIAEGRIIWPAKPTGRPRHKKFLNELESEFTGFSSIIECGNTNEGTEEVQQILGDAGFIFPKPKSLMVQLVQQAAPEENDIVLDSFAGSGTTGHSVLEVSKLENKNRRFILVEMDSTIARNITAQRIKRVAEGYTNSQGERVDGLGGGFRFATLGDPLFDEKGNIRSTVRFGDLARHVYFTETGEPMPRQVKATSPLIGRWRGKAIYLLYNGILKDKSPDGGNVLTTSVMRCLPAHDGPKVIFGTACRLGSERLRREGIEFKQLPYKLKVGSL
jgi:site-specific DNA-methyltransferase (adenine-specific)/adenine-specific DNA-methyltransferase